MEPNEGKDDNYHPTKYHEMKKTRGADNIFTK